MKNIRTIFVLSLFAVTAPSWAQVTASMRLDSSYVRERQNGIVGFLYTHRATGFDYNGQDSIAQIRKLHSYTETLLSPPYLQRKYTDTYQYSINGKIVLQEPSYGGSNLRHTFILNNSGQPVHQLVEQWQDPIWKPTAQYFFTYNSKDLEVERLSQKWNYLVLGWGNGDRWEHNYNDQDQEIFYRQSKWDYDSLNWVITAETENFYDSFGRKIEQVNRKRTSLILHNLSRYLWIYNNQNRLDTFQDYHNLLSVWKKSRQTIYFYDNDGNEVLQNNYGAYLNEWAFSGKKVLFPNPSGLKIADSTLLYRWKSSGQIFELEEREMFTFLELPDHRFYYRYQVQDFFDLDWMEKLLEEYWYTDVPSIGVKEESEIACSACKFPNPYSAGQTIYCPGFTPYNQFQARLFGLDGRLMYRISIRGNETWSIDPEFPAGLYNLVIFKNGQPIAAQKVVML